MGHRQAKITSYRDLDVYQRSYQSMLIVMNHVVPKLPLSERYDLSDQLSRASKAIPRLIAEGYAKCHQKKGFQKHLEDAMAECNEMVVSLCQSRDLYGCFVDPKVCDEHIVQYDTCGKQLYRLKEAWDAFKNQQPRPLTRPAS